MGRIIGASAGLAFPIFEGRISCRKDDIRVLSKIQDPGCITLQAEQSMSQSLPEQLRSSICRIGKSRSSLKYLSKTIPRRHQPGRSFASRRFDEESEVNIRPNDPDEEVETAPTPAVESNASTNDSAFSLQTSHIQAQRLPCQRRPRAAWIRSISTY